MTGGANVASTTGAVDSGAALHFRALQIVLFLHCFGLLAQPSIAGEFLSGTDAVVKFHEWAGWAILGLCAIQIGLAVLAMRSGLATLWLLIGSIWVFLAEGLQVGSGYGQFLRVHVPLGVIVFGAVLLQTIAVFRRSSGNVK